MAFNQKFYDLRKKVDLFSKVYSPCCCILSLNKTSTDNITNITIRVQDAILDDFYIDRYLDLFDS